MRVVLVAFYWRALRNMPEARRGISISSRWVLAQVSRLNHARELHLPDPARWIV